MVDVASMFVLTPFILGVVIGQVLSDGYLQFLNPGSVNVALGFTQSLALGAVRPSWPSPL